jgi:hypothetical protein
VAPYQIPLQRPHLARLNPNLRQLSKSGIDPVSSLTASEHSIHHSARRANARQRSRIKRNRAIPQRDLRNFFKTERLAGEQQRRRHHERQGTAFRV